MYMRKEKKKKKKKFIKRLTISLICIGIIVGGSVPIFTKLKTKTAYAESLKQTEKVAVLDQLNSINNELNTLGLNNITDAHNKTLAESAIDYIKIGSIYSAKNYISNIKDNKKLQDNLNTFMNWYDSSQKENIRGELTSKKGISKDIFSNTQYSGISNIVSSSNMPYYKLTSPNTVVQDKVYYYNPNILTTKTLYSFYKNIMKTNENNQNSVNYILRDIYNPNYAIWINTNCDQFNTGNINPYGYMLLNKNLYYAQFGKNGQVYAYNSLTNKGADFVLK